MTAKVGYLPDLIDTARAAVSGRPWRARGIEAVRVPTADVEVDVDMESADGGTYLWGARVSGDTQLADSYVAHVTWEPLDHAGEAALFGRFWRWLTGLRDRAHTAGRTFAAYYYTPAENTQMRRALHIAGPDLPPEGDVEAFIASDEWVDLHQIMTSQIVTGHGTGLKRVAPIAGFHWRDSDSGGDQSTVWYQAAVYADDQEVREANRRRLLDYNQDDVAATAALRHWLATQGRALPSIENWKADG